MSDPVVAPAPEAAAIETTVTPPVAPVAPVAPAEDTGLSSRVFKLLTNPGTETAPAKPVATEPAKTEPAKVPVAEKPIKVKPAKAAATAPAETPPPVPKREDLTKSAPATAPVAAAAAPAPVVDDTAFEKSLVEEEQVLLDDARAAEKLLGAKYAGQGGKMLKFLKDSAAKEADVTAGKIDADEYREWYQKNLPKLSVRDSREIQHLQAVERAKKEFEPKIEQERHARWVDAEAPKAKAKGNEVYNKLASSALPDELAAAITERTKGITDRAEYVKAVQAAQKDYALESEVHDVISQAAAGDIEEFHRLTTTNPATGRALSDFDDKNEQHNRIINMVSGICNEFKATGGADLKKDGKWFVTREEWTGMAPEQRAPFWTFTNEQLIDRAMANVKGAVNAAVEQRKKWLEDRGFKRTIAAPVVATTAPVVQPATRTAPPAPRPSPAPSGNAATIPSLGAALAAKLSG